MSTDSGDLATAPWGTFGSGDGRRVSWGSPVEVQVEKPVLPTTARHALPDPQDTPAPAQAPATPAPMEPVGLGGLFGAPSPTPEPESVTDPTPAGDGLGGLFGTPPSAADPRPEPGTPNSAFDLSSVFGPGTPEPAPAQDLAAEQAPAAELAPQRDAGAVDLSAVFGGPRTPEPAVATHEPEPAALDAAAPAPVPQAQTEAFSGATNPFGPTTASAAEPAQGVSTSVGSRLAAQRAAVEAARAQRPQDTSATDVAHALANNARYTRASELEPLVERLLGLGAGAGDPALASFFKHLELTRDVTLDSTQRARYQQMLEPLVATGGIQFLTADDMRIAFDIAYDEMIGIGPLGPLWRDPQINEIMVSGPNKVTIERGGRLEITPVRFRDLAHLQTVARRLGAASQDDRAISATNPLVTIHLPGARVQFVWKPLAVNKVVIAIRKFGDLLGMTQLLGFGSMSAEMADFLAAAVSSRSTILVSGGTSSGKTTFINALSEFIPDSERVITIEDALELQLRNTHVEALVTKEASSADDRVLFGQDALLKAALRLNPDRIIVGEIRDGKGATVMLEAANTGHDGTMTTIHANSPRDALRRLTTLVRRVEGMPDDVAREEVGSAINLVVQVVKVRGRRFVSHISTVDQQTCQTQDVFVGEYPVGASEPTFRLDTGLGADTAVALKMTDNGIDPSAWRR